jgi:hypothetical protein
LGALKPWLGAQYTASLEFNQLDPRTQHVGMCHELIAPGASENLGDCPLSRFNMEAVGILRDRKAATPEAANNRVKRLRAVFKWALGRKVTSITANPAREVSKLKPKRKGGFPVWKAADLDKFKARHPIGTIRLGTPGPAAPHHPEGHGLPPPTLHPCRQILDSPPRHAERLALRQRRDLRE